MDKKRESGDIIEHMLLEEVKIDSINFIEPPDEWNPELHQNESYVPPVLIKEKHENDEISLDDAKEYTLLAHHRCFWKAAAKGQFTLKVLVVHSNVHISLAHESIKNCSEEALLFDALLRNGLCENRSRLSELMGYSRARITQILNLLKLPIEMRRKLLLTDDISEFQLRPIIRVMDSKVQKEMFDHLINDKFTGRQMALFAGEKEKKEEQKELADIEDLMNESIVSEKAKTVHSEGDEESIEEAVSSDTARSNHTARIMQLLKLRNSDWEKEAEKKNISGTEMEFLKGVFKLRNGLYNEAMDILKSVTEQDPECAPAYFYIGKCLNLTGKPDSAENFLRTALELVPGEPDYLVELAIVLEKLKRDSEASVFYKKAGLLRRKSSSRV